MSVVCHHSKFSHLYKTRSLNPPHRDSDDMTSNHRTRSFPFFGQVTSRLHKQFFNRGLVSCLTHQTEPTTEQATPPLPTFHPLPPHPHCIEQLLEVPRADLATQVKHAWNPEDRSLNIFIKDDDVFSIHRHPVAQSTDGIRSRVGFSSGVHLWEVTWPTRQRGTHAVVGIATKEAPLHCPGYKPLIGNNNDSWGWDIGRNKLIHQGLDLSDKGHALPSVDTNHNFCIPDTFGLVLDMQEGTLGFVINGRYLGVAFDGLKHKTVYPAVSAVWGHCEVSMRYVSSLPSQPLSLLEASRREIERRVRGAAYQDILQLPLPSLLKQLLLHSAPQQHQPVLQQLLTATTHNSSQPVAKTQQQQPPQPHKQQQPPHKLQQQQQRHRNDHHTYVSMPLQQHVQLTQQHHVQHHIQRVQQQHNYHRNFPLKPYHL